MLDSGRLAGGLAGVAAAAAVADVHAVIVAAVRGLPLRLLLVLLLLLLRLKLVKQYQWLFSCKVAQLDLKPGVLPYFSGTSTQKIAKLY